MPADGIDASIYGDLHPAQPMDLLGMGFRAAEMQNAIARARMINMEVSARQGLAEIAQQSQNPDGTINFEKMGMAAYANPKTAPMATEFVTQMLTQRKINAEAYGQELANNRAQLDAANGLMAGVLAKRNIVQKDVMGPIAEGYGLGLYDLNTVAQIVQGLPPDQINPQTGEVTNPALRAAVVQLVNTTNAGRATSDKMIGDFHAIQTPGGGYDLGTASGITGWHPMGSIAPTEPTVVTNAQGDTTTMPRGEAPGFEGGTPPVVPAAGVQGGAPIGGAPGMAPQGGAPGAAPGLGGGPGMAPMVGGGMGDTVGVDPHVAQAYGVGGPPASQPSPQGAGAPPSPAPSGGTPGGAAPAKGFRSGLPLEAKQYLSGEGPIRAYQNTLETQVMADNAAVQTIGEMMRALDGFRSGRGTTAFLEAVRVMDTLGVPKEMRNAFLGAHGKGDAVAEALEFEKLASPYAIQALRAAQSSGTRQTDQQTEVFFKTQPNLETTPGAIEKIFNFAKWRAGLNSTELDQWIKYKNTAEDRGWPINMKLSDFPNIWQRGLIRNHKVNYDPTHKY